jgi:trk system potassium uptake protein TrkH
MNFFNSTVYSLGTAGTGGFAVDPDGLASYAAYSQYVIAGGMLVFGINFSLFYLILIKKAKEAFKNEELRLYLAIVAISVVTIFATVYSTYNNIEEAFRHSLFQVATIISTTGYATYDFIQWPTLALGILFILMFSGGCAGSTAGGMKVTRLGILFKSSIRKVKNEVSPRKVEMVSVDGKALNDSVIESVQSYFVLYIFIAVICAVIYSFDGFDLLTNFTASITCLSNVGPGLTAVIGPMGNFAGFSNFSKLLMAFEMIAGRLELFPILILFNPKTWKKM